MVRLEKELAVTGIVNEFLLSRKEPVIDFDAACHYANVIEARSGHAVLLNFSENDLTWLLSKHKELFQYDAGKKAYTLRMHTNPETIKDTQIRWMVRNVIDALDPAWNQPMDALESMRLMDVLQQD